MAQTLDDINLYVWAEFLPYDELVKPEVVGLLKQFNATIGVALHHDTPRDDLANLLNTYGEHESPVTLWVLLDKKDGYWPNERNVDKFSDHLRRLMDWIEGEGLALPDFAIDLEPPLEDMELRKSKIRAERREGKKRFRSNVNPKRFQDASEKFSRLNNEIHQRGAKTITAASFTIADDLRNGDVYTQDLIETPVTTVPWDRISVMWYVSMATGYSKGLFPYSAARWQLYRDAKTIISHLGEERASVSVGVTWTGVLGDEPYYKKPEHMRPDVEAAKAAGIKHIGIYNLEGILKAERPADWFDMIINAQPIPPRKTVAARLSTPTRKTILRAVRFLY